MKNVFAGVLAMVALTLSFGQVDPNRVVAVINGEEIKGAEYYRRMEFLPCNLPSGQQGLNNVPAGFLTIKEIITERLIFQLARSKSVYPTEPEVDAEYKSTLEENPQLLENWEAQGQTADELRNRVKFMLTQFKLQTAGITITDQELENHYAQYPSEFTIPKRIRLRVIVVNDPSEQKEVDQELSSGQPFADIAKRHSIDITKNNGGDRGTLEVDQLSAAIRPAIEGTSAGKTTDWIPAGEKGSPSQCKFQVEQVYPSHKQELTQEVRRHLRRRLMIDKGNVKNNMAKDLRAATLSAKIEIREPAFDKIYRAILDGLRRGM